MCHRQAHGRGVESRPMNEYAPSELHTRIFNDGWRAHDAGKALVDNPHPEMSHAYNEWEDGYYAAQAAKATRYGG